MPGQWFEDIFTVIVLAALSFYEAPERGSGRIYLGTYHCLQH